MHVRFVMNNVGALCDTQLSTHRVVISHICLLRRSHVSVVRWHTRGRLPIRWKCIRRLRLLLRLYLLDMHLRVSIHAHARRRRSPRRTNVAVRNRRRVRILAVLIRTQLASVGHRTVLLLQYGIDARVHFNKTLLLRLSRAHLLLLDERTEEAGMECTGCGGGHVGGGVAVRIRDREDELKDGR